MHPSLEKPESHLGRLQKFILILLLYVGSLKGFVKTGHHNLIFPSAQLCSLFFLSRTARRSNQSILNEISPGISLEGMMIKLKLQYFGHLVQRVDSLEKSLTWEGLGARGEGQDRG